LEFHARSRGGPAPKEPILLFICVEEFGGEEEESRPLRKYLPPAWLISEYLSHCLALK
jgi:hypothetical protein